MDALLASLRFEGRDQPRPVQAMEVGGDCAAAPTAPAATLQAANGADAAEDSIMAAADALPEQSENSDFPRQWCLSSLRRAGTDLMPIWRIPPSAAGADSRRVVTVAVLDDSDGAIEVVERRFQNRSRFTTIWHSTGRTNILGSYDGSPTDAQITGPDRGQR